MVLVNDVVYFIVDLKENGTPSIEYRMFNKLESGLGKYAEEKLIFQIKLYTPSA
jgi:hypothetical protein